MARLAFYDCCGEELLTEKETSEVIQSITPNFARVEKVLLHRESLANGSSSSGGGVGGASPTRNPGSPLIGRQRGGASNADDDATSRAVFSDEATSPSVEVLRECLKNALERTINSEVSPLDPDWSCVSTVIHNGEPLADDVKLVAALTPVLGRRTSPVIDGGPTVVELMIMTVPLREYQNLEMPQTATGTSRIHNYFPIGDKTKLQPQGLLALSNDLGLRAVLHQEIDDLLESSSSSPMAAKKTETSSATPRQRRVSESGTPLASWPALIQFSAAVARDKGQSALEVLAAAQEEREEAEEEEAAKKKESSSNQDDATRNETSSSLLEKKRTAIRELLPQELISTLHDDVGFPRLAAERALLESKMNVEYAMNFLLSVDDVSALDTELTAEEVEKHYQTLYESGLASGVGGSSGGTSGRRKNGGGGGALTAAEAQVIAMGFDARLVRVALKMTNGDPNLAATLIVERGAAVEAAAKEISWVEQLQDTLADRKDLSPMVMVSIVETVLRRPHEVPAMRTDAKLSKHLEAICALFENSSSTTQN